MYPVLAGQIIERTGKQRGTALDIGSGPAHLAASVAEQSDLRIFALDSSPRMVRIAFDHISTADLVTKVVPVLGDVHTLPFRDGTIDLVFSRGSWLFWKDLFRAFQEIYRVLAPGGFAYIGGGFGNSHLKKKISDAMKDKNPECETEVVERSAKNSPDRMKNEIETAPIRSYDLIRDESGFWVVFTK